MKVKVNSLNNSIWLHGLSELYIPVAHGEGRFFFENNSVYLSIKDKIALQYVTDDGDLANQKFPYNPNSSMYDIAALSSNEWKVLIMMPHPERAIFSYNKIIGLK